MSDSPARSPSSLAPAYLAPYVAYVALGALADPRAHAELIYAARMLAVGGALAFFWRDYVPLRGPRSPWGSLAYGALAGLSGSALWIALRRPFAAANAPAWSESAWLARAVGSTLLPPFAEELLFRGWVLRSVLLFERARAAGRAAPLAEALDRASLADVSPGQASALAVLVSSALFAAGHLPAEWPAAFAYAALMCALWIWRGDLVSCVSAHAATNLALALFARAQGDWGVW
ncbi:MAG: type II CAAX prenyl endopeptidase Rce1 family protein [Myxococcota bacterium]